MSTTYKKLTASYQLMGAGPLAVVPRSAGNVLYHITAGAAPADGTNDYFVHNKDDSEDEGVVNYAGTENVYARVSDSLILSELNIEVAVVLVA